LIDDTLNQHQKGAIEGLAYLKDHTVNRYAWAHNVVTAHYLNRQDQFPVDFRPYHQFRVKLVIWGHQDVRAGRCVVGFNQPVRDVSWSLMNCWAIWSTG